MKSLFSLSNDKYVIVALHHIITLKEYTLYITTFPLSKMATINGPNVVTLSLSLSLSLQDLLFVYFLCTRVAPFCSFSVDPKP